MNDTNQESTLNDDLINYQNKLNIQKKTKQKIFMLRNNFNYYDFYI